MRKQSSRGLRRRQRTGKDRPGAERVRHAGPVSPWQAQREEMAGGLCAAPGLSSDPLQNRCEKRGETR